MKTRILFLHGLESQPGGTKVKYLESLGYNVLNPHLPASSFQESLDIAQKIFDNENPDIVIGSSKGGAVAMAVDARGIKKVLIAPAYKRYNVSADNLDETTTILHSVCDNIVPLIDSVELSTAYGCRIHTCGADHRMSDPDALKMLKSVIEKNYHE